MVLWAVDLWTADPAVHFCRLPVHQMWYEEQILPLLRNRILTLIAHASCCWGLHDDFVSSSSAIAVEALEAHEVSCPWFSRRVYLLLSSVACLWVA